MKALVFTGDRDKPGKSDYTGAFDPESASFAKLHGIPADNVVKVDTSKSSAAMRQAIEGAIATRSNLDLIAFLCHGWQSGIQLGYTTKTVDSLAHAISAASATAAPIVALYCCSTAGGPGAGGDGGFADKLRDALCAHHSVNCVVTGHDRAGHSTRLAYVRRFDGLGSPIGGTGGNWIVAPSSPLWAPWRKALASKTNTLRFRYPTMGIAEVHRELLAEVLA